MAGAPTVAAPWGLRWSGLNSVTLGAGLRQVLHPRPLGWQLVRWILWNSFYKQDVKGHYDTGDCHSSMQPGSNHSSWQAKTERERDHTAHTEPHHQAGTAKPGCEPADLSRTSEWCSLFQILSKYFLRILLYSARRFWQVELQMKRPKMKSKNVSKLTNLKLKTLMYSFQNGRNKSGKIFLPPKVAIPAQPKIISFISFYSMENIKLPAC